MANDEDYDLAYLRRLLRIHRVPSAWSFQMMVSLFLCTSICGWTILLLEVPNETKAVMFISVVFLMGSVFFVSRTLKDRAYSKELNQLLLLRKQMQKQGTTQ
eukprot:JP448746.1.p1 GENE.JP448746.1~~JP448746.1.p1  ORF type:complete len:102 (+),score=15.47 JP448746.1:24-329(+)